MQVQTKLWRWSGESATWHFLNMPEDQAQEIRAESLMRRGGFGSVRVEATIDDVTWRTSVFPQKSGGWFLPVKKAICRAEDLAAGDEVMVRLELR